ncbi:L-serine ammonia-lyase [Ensifer sp.]|uniref:L-serine ammonia-lyase n=1 Tax=Ensifer sp. TaxID=1872086 RepID=UPI00289658BA|nr:L-serine ammonia-lyase [Ensifer sp.]
MFLSVFDIFKIGIGPSSSHTMGPMVAASRFLTALTTLPDRAGCTRLAVSLHGSLAFTGKGHATDRAVFLGLMGCLPETLDPDQAEAMVAQLRVNRTITVPAGGPVAFDPDHDLVFDYGPPLPGHANGMVFTAFYPSGEILLRQVFYSIGGGFVVSEDELSGQSSSRDSVPADVPYPFTSAVEMLRMGKGTGLSIAAMKEANERARHGPELEPGLERLQAAMNACLDRGLRHDGILPGGLSVRRRARGLHQQLLSERGSNQVQPHAATDWLLVYAMAVNEENAAGGRVVTAPTNGAAGVVPAVLRYYRDHCIGASAARARQFLLTAAAIGGLIKHRASISGAECGCQAEVGSASAMAAAGLCAALGGTNEQVENAAEIALEHHLGMTCDPVAGLVQVPCIERNGLGAIKAVSAASLALRGDGQHFMPLDNCIETMRQTGQDMADKYKETSIGGLAVNLPEC